MCAATPPLNHGSSPPPHPSACASEYTGAGWRNAVYEVAAYQTEFEACHDGCDAFTTTEAKILTMTLEQCAAAASRAGETLFGLQKPGADGLGECMYGGFGELQEVATSRCRAVGTDGVWRHLGRDDADGCTTALHSLYAPTSAPCYVPAELPGYKYSPDGTDSLPLLAYFNEATGSHLYTTDPGEIGATEANSVGKDGFKFEGVLGYVRRGPQAGPSEDTVPLYRYLNTGTTVEWLGLFRDTSGHAGKHVFSTSAAKSDGLTSVPGATLKSNGHAFQAALGHIATQPSPGARPLLQFWNCDTGDQILTTDELTHSTGAWRWDYDESLGGVFSANVNAPGYVYVATLGYLDQRCPSMRNHTHYVQYRGCQDKCATLGSIFRRYYLDLTPERCAATAAFYGYGEFALSVASPSSECWIGLQQHNFAVEYSSDENCRASDESRRRLLSAMQSRTAWSEAWGVSPADGDVGDAPRAADRHLLHMPDGGDSALAAKRRLVGVIDQPDYGDMLGAPCHAALYDIFRYNDFAIEYNQCLMDQPADELQLFSTVAPRSTLQGCATTAWAAGHARFALKHPEIADLDGLAECWYGDQAITGSPQVRSDSECVGESWKGKFHGKDYIHNGAAGRAAVYSIVAPRPATSKGSARSAFCPQASGQGVDLRVEAAACSADDRGCSGFESSRHTYGNLRACRGYFSKVRDTVAPDITASASGGVRRRRLASTSSPPLGSGGSNVTALMAARPPSGRPTASGATVRVVETGDDQQAGSNPPLLVQEDGPSSGGSAPGEGSSGGGDQQAGSSTGSQVWRGPSGAPRTSSARLTRRNLGARGNVTVGLMASLSGNHSSSGPSGTIRTIEQVITLIAKGCEMTPGCGGSGRRRGGQQGRRLTQIELPVILVGTYSGADILLDTVSLPYASTDSFPSSACNCPSLPLQYDSEYFVMGLFLPEIPGVFSGGQICFAYEGETAAAVVSPSLAVDNPAVRATGIGAAIAQAAAAVEIMGMGVSLSGDLLFEFENAFWEGGGSANVPQSMNGHLFVSGIFSPELPGFNFGTLTVEGRAMVNFDPNGDGIPPVMETLLGAPEAIASPEVLGLVMSSMQSMDFQLGVAASASLAIPVSEWSMGLMDDLEVNLGGAQLLVSNSNGHRGLWIQGRTGSSIAAATISGILDSVLKPIKWLLDLLGIDVPDLNSLSIPSTGNQLDIFTNLETRRAGIKLVTSVVTLEMSAGPGRFKMCAKFGSLLDTCSLDNPFSAVFKYAKVAVEKLVNLADDVGEAVVELAADVSGVLKDGGQVMVTAVGDGYKEVAAGLTSAVSWAGGSAQAVIEGIAEVDTLVLDGVEEYLEAMDDLANAASAAGEAALAGAAAASQAARSFFRVG